MHLDTFFVFFQLTHQIGRQTSRLKYVVIIRTLDALSTIRSRFIFSH